MNNLEQLVKAEVELSNICKGQCSNHILHEKKYICTLARHFESEHIIIKCDNLYNYSNFPNVCLYKK